jgi:hypothetical protein
VEDAIEALKSSLKVLESANNVNDQVDQSRYFAALKVWRESNGLPSKRCLMI